MCMKEKCVANGRLINIYKEEDDRERDGEMKEEREGDGEMKSEKGWDR